MGGFTTLERAGLESICEVRRNAAPLRDLLASARFTERDNTGHGFFACVAIDPGLPPVRMQEPGVKGPLARMEVLGPGDLMGFVPWFEDGRRDCLEGFQYGDEQGATIDLRTRDLSSLTFSRLDPPDAEGGAA